ncbi:MAG: DUF58 domain-containing protein [Deltaproteobacteria bacterium]|nr:MAG: DUF58 domain-containing protein [Deltaproteobacteria bacterium]
MTVWPDVRLVRAVAAWAIAALLVAVWPALWLACTVGLALIVSFAAWDLAAAQPALRLARRLPPRAFTGREAEVTIELEHDGDAAIEADVVDEAPADVVPLEPWRRGVVVPPRGRATIRYAIRPGVRGDRGFGPALALVRSPLGLFRRRVAAGDGELLRVYPDASRFLRREVLDPKRLLATVGARPALRRGEGMEFESLRDYVPGDDLRRIDWAASARRGRAVTRLYEQERRRTIVVAVDTSRLMAGVVDGRTKLDHAVDAALALGYAGLVSGDRVAMCAFDAELGGFVASRGHRRHLGAFLDFLRMLAPTPVEADYRALLRGLERHQRQRALLVVLTDFVEADPMAIVAPLGILGRHHRVLLVAVRDRAYNLLAPDARPADDDGLAPYRRLVVDDLLREREATLARLRRRGLQTLDLAPSALTAAVLNRYLAIRDAPAR